MKNICIIIIATCLTPILFTSCKKALEKQDLGTFTADQVYNDSTTAKLNIDYIYTQNQPGWFGNSGGYIGGTGGLTDESYSDNPQVKGTVSVNDVGDIGSTNTSGNYAKLRVINTFIRDINAGTLATPVKKRFTAQAIFWRAYRYFELVKLYGGVPIVLTPLDAVGSEAKAAANLPRNTTTETFTQIVNDLDSCVKYLPTKWPLNADYGRITSGAAAALLGRVLVTWASPQWNPTQDQSRWQAAYDANSKAVSILSNNGFGLYKTWDYTMWTTEGSASGSTPQNSEAVLVTEYNTATDDIGRNSNTYPNQTLPKSTGAGGGSNQPTWDLVQAFPMLDGKMPGSSKYPYIIQTFYKNRDPRFNQTIAYNGCSWPILGNPSYRLWTYYYYTNTAATATKSTESSASTTGFYLRKAIDPSITLTNLSYAGTDWIEIRYAEVLLNLAESAAELNKLSIGQEAYTGLIAIRKRAGIEAGTDGLYGLTTGMDHDQMINAIMYERQIEFAFEGKRYWDLRRRLLLDKTLNDKRRTGLTIVLNQTGTGTSKSTSDYILSTRDVSASTSSTSLDNLYSTSFTITPKILDTYNIAYQKEIYYFGIPTATLNNNVNIQQNNTWGGSFDPLK